MSGKLVIVESPSKSRTIGNYLGKDYHVTSSKGHIRDLATTGKGGLGVDIEHDFKPVYVINKDKKDVVKALKEDVKNADEVYLATDPDREGEAISWHLAEVLGLDPATTHRVVFNEVTKNAVRAAIASPRTIDMNLVHSQETRRVLDRLIGFRLSQLLRTKIKSRSAGRVQSVALKLIVDKEREIAAFVPQEYWEIKALLEKDGIRFEAELDKKIKMKNEAEANAIYERLGKTLTLTDVKKSARKRESKPPFITSTLQQEASGKLGFAAKKTMMIAQKLYEGVDVSDGPVGLITYMRTDSVRLSEDFVKAARQYIIDNYGKQYVGRVKKARKTENVQDAHEAIRPTDITRTPDLVKPYLSRDEYRLYAMIYARALASLMAPCGYDATSLSFDDHGYVFKAAGSQMTFDGYLKVYGPYEKTQDTPLPKLETGETLTAESIDKSQHFTKPPARYTEAKLIKELEELGIGRPSTYASIIDTIQSRDYVELVDRQFHPTESGMLTNDRLQEYFSSIINVAYTAEMEKQLDKIAEGEDSYVHTLTDFNDKFEPLLENAYEKMEKVEAKKTGEICPLCGHELVERKGRYGTFVACSNYPACKYIKKEPQQLEETGELCPKCGSPMVKRFGKYGPFEACSNYPDCKYIKPKEKTKTAAKVVEGMTCPNCGGPVVERKGRFGPFLACANYPKCKTVLGKPDSQ